MSSLRYAVVTPTYERLATDDASDFVADVVSYLKPRADVEILTTRASEKNWPRNVYPEGHERIDGIHVRRFTCDRSTSAITTYLSTFGKRYDCVLFIGSLDRIVTFGIESVIDRALVVPFDVPPPEELVREHRELLRRVVAFLFPSETDRRHVLSIEGTNDGPAIMARVRPPRTIEAERFRSKFGRYEPFFFLGGSSDRSGARDRLIESFQLYVRETGSRRKLVIPGDDAERGPSGVGEVVFTGRLDSAETWDALSACEACLIVDGDAGMEACWKAWSVEKPVVVDAGVTALVEECRRSGGGLWYEGPTEFVSTLELIDERELTDVAAQGKQYVSQYISHQRIASALRQFFV